MAEQVIVETIRSILTNEKFYPDPAKCCKPDENNLIVYAQDDYKRSPELYELFKHASKCAEKTVKKNIWTNKASEGRPEFTINDLIILPEVSFNTMNIFLDILSNRHLDELILLFCDQASFHRNKELNIPENIIIKYIPPYSPELNPSEDMWGEIREKYFGNYTFKSMKAVEDRLVEASLFYENHTNIVQSVTGFDWIVNTLLIAN